MYFNIWHFWVRQEILQITTMYYQLEGNLSDTKVWQQCKIYEILSHPKVMIAKHNPTECSRSLCDIKSAQIWIDITILIRM